MVPMNYLMTKQMYWIITGLLFCIVIVYLVLTSLADKLKRKEYLEKQQKLIDLEVLAGDLTEFYFFQVPNFSNEIWICDDDKPVVDRQLKIIENGSCVYSTEANWKIKEYLENRGCEVKLFGWK